MAALRSRCRHCIFALWFVSSCFPCLVSVVADWMSTILAHMVWPECEFRMQVWKVVRAARWKYGCKNTHTTVLRPFFRDHPGEPMPEENFWTLQCKGRLTEADTLTIWLGTTPSGLTSAHLHHPPYFLPAGCPSCRPTNSVKALRATSTFGLGRRSRVLLNGVTCTVSVPRQDAKIAILAPLHNFVELYLRN